MICSAKTGVACFPSLCFAEAMGARHVTTLPRKTTLALMADGRSISLESPDLLKLSVEFVVHSHKLRPVRQIPRIS